MAADQDGSWGSVMFIPKGTGAAMLPYGLLNTYSGSSHLFMIQLHPYASRHTASATHTPPDTWADLLKKLIAC